MNEKRFTGVCICGHSWDDHHHGIIMNMQSLIDKGNEYRAFDGELGQECEHTNFEGIRIHTDEPECMCRCYEDVGWKANL